MKTRLMLIRLGRTPLHLTIALLALVIGARCSSESSGLTGGEEPTPTTGTISVTVISGGGSPITATATVKLTGPTERTTTGNIGATLTITDLPPGTYTVVATASSFITCQSVSADVHAGQTTTANISCTRTTGRVAVTVTSGGSPISGAPVTLTGAGLEMTRTTGADGAFTFVVKPGEYTVTAVLHHFTCPVQTVLVELDQTTTAALSCAPKTTGTITGTVTAPDFGPIHGATIDLTGPVSRTATAGSLDSSFAFDELPPGTYTVTATAFGWACQSASADVRAAQTTTVQISCTARPPIGSEIEGNWGYNRLLRSQTGSCPPPLPATGTGSMTFSPSDDTIRIVGLDPELAIGGVYDEETGSYTGSGAAVLSDGSTIQSVVTVTFGFDFESFVVFFTDATPSSVWTRQHRGPSGNLVCTEIYGAGGGN